MTTLYVSQRRPQQEASHKRSFMHHVAWGILCIMLLSVVAGMWTYSQSLQAQVNGLRQQLAVGNSTCKVTGDWKEETSKQLTMATPSGLRNYIVHTPKGFSDNKYYPLVMFFPGKGASAEGSELAFGLDSLPAIMVYPFPTEGTDGYTAWESAPYSSGADDISFTSAILDKLQAEMCVDKTRVYATGFSNGGGFASLLSCKLPDRFAAYAIVAGALYAPSSGCRPPRAAPIISIHGDNDPIVPYDGSLIRNLPPIYEWTAQRATLENCGRPTTTYTSASTIATIWNDCRGGSSIENVRVIGGEHVWGSVSNESLWQFLTRFTL